MPPEGRVKPPPPQQPAQASVPNYLHQNRRDRKTAAQDRADLRNDFSSLPIVKNFGVIASKAGSALNQPETPAGDLAIMYAFAQVNDPTSVVRESEQQMAERTASTVAQLRQKYDMVTEGKRLPPGVRNGLLESMRANVRVINDFYGSEYKRWRGIAEKHGFDPENITGPYLGDLMRPLEEQYIRRAGGTPRTEAEARGEFASWRDPPRPTGRWRRPVRATSPAAGPRRAGSVRRWN